MTKQSSTSTRLLALMGLALAGLVVVAAIIVAFREPATFAPGTPEAAVQTYLNAVLSDDAAAAHAQLTPELQARCDVADLDDRYYTRDPGRITLEETTTRQGEAVVEVEFTATYSGSPFDVYQSAYHERFELAPVGDEWRIADVPWPFYWCPEE